VNYAEDVLWNKCGNEQPNRLRTCDCAQTSGAQQNDITVQFLKYTFNDYYDNSNNANPCAVVESKISEVS